MGTAGASKCGLPCFEGPTSSLMSSRPSSESMVDWRRGGACATVRVASSGGGVWREATDQVSRRKPAHGAQSALAEHADKRCPVKVEARVSAKHGLIVDVAVRC